jgi:hypothetical protein
MLISRLVRTLGCVNSYVTPLPSRKSVNVVSSVKFGASCVEKAVSWPFSSKVPEMSELEIVSVPVIRSSSTSWVKREYSIVEVPAPEISWFETIRTSSRIGIVSHGENFGLGMPGPP